MLRTFLLLGLALIVGSALIGIVLGVAGAVVWFLIKVLLLGAAVYFVLRLVSPRTAARLRDKFESHSLPRL